MERTQTLIEDYLYAEREPLSDEIPDLINCEKPTILELKKVGDRILSKILDFVDTFIEGKSILKNQTNLNLLKRSSNQIIFKRSLFISRV